MKIEKISALPFILNIVANYYDLIPEKYKTYCIMNAQICQEVFRHFNMPAYLLPCQLWYVTETNNYVLGFVGNEPQPNIWDGHVVCATDDYLIDASLVHLRNQYGIDVPDAVIGQRFKIPTHVVARENLSDGSRLWWHDAPAVVQRHPVLEDMELVKQLARPLIDHLEQLYMSDLEAAFAAEQSVPRAMAG